MISELPADETPFSGQVEIRYEEIIWGWNRTWKLILYFEFLKMEAFYMIVENAMLETVFIGSSSCLGYTTKRHTIVVLDNNQKIHFISFIFNLKLKLLGIPLNNFKAS